MDSWKTVIFCVLVHVYLKHKLFVGYSYLKDPGQFMKFAANNLASVLNIRGLHNVHYCGSRTRIKNHWNRRIKHNSHKKRKGIA